MDDQTNKRNSNFDGEENERNSESAESTSSYYYSYGPFQSIGKDNEEQGSGGYSEYHDQENVDIMRPQPVKSISTFQSDIPTVNGGAGTPPSNNNRNWQYNKKPKSTFKSVMAGMLAGMLIMTGAMVYADRTNMFTSGQVVTTASTQASASNANTGTTTPKTQTALYPITDPGDVISVVDQASPAVVKIETLMKSSKQNQYSTPDNMDPFYRYFFGDSYGGGTQGQGQEDSNKGSSSDTLVPTGIGSGFIFDKSGYILTNEHVVHNADAVQVTLQDNAKPYEATVLGTSYELDLAVLKIESDDSLPSIPLADSSDTKVGEWLVAIGNPQGFDHTVTAGVLSAKERGITINGENGEKDRVYEHLLQTDASINPGNSGGPLLNLNGEVVGINVAVSSDAQGIGFAIPTSTISEVLEKLKNNEEIPKTPAPFIGASLMTVTEEVAKEMGTDVKEGSIVSEIVYKSPAYNADLRPYDIITGADGKSFATKEELTKYIQQQKVGNKVVLNVVRDGKKLDLNVTIGDKNEFANLK